MACCEPVCSRTHEAFKLLNSSEITSRHPRLDILPCKPLLLPTQLWFPDIADQEIIIVIIIIIRLFKVESPTHFTSKSQALGVLI